MAKFLVEIDIDDRTHEEIKDPENEFFDADGKLVVDAAAYLEKFSEDDSFYVFKVVKEL